MLGRYVDSCSLSTCLSYGQITSEQDAMNGYFKPLRRKIGVVTLMMACVAMGGRFRSETEVDFIGIRFRDSVYSCVSYCGVLHWDVATPTERPPLLAFGSMNLSWLSNAFRKEVGGFEIWLLPKLIEDDWVGQTSLCDYPPQMEQVKTRKTISHMLIVLPLTLLSTCLLLSRPTPAVVETRDSQPT